MPYQFGGASGSPSIGRIICPSLPVDSATSCSSQAPSAAISGARMSVSLSLPASAATPSARPRLTPGFFSDLGLAAGGGELRSAREVARQVQPQQRRRHQPERRKRRETPADRRLARHQRQETPLARQAVERRVGIRDGDEARRGVLPQGRFEVIQEVGKEKIGLDRRAGLARHHHPGRRRIEEVRERPHLVGMRRVEDMEARKATPQIALAERSAQHLRAQRRAAHAEEEDVAHPLVGGHPRQLGIIAETRRLALGCIEPAQPIGLVAPGPDRGIAFPDPPRAVAGPPGGGGRVERNAQLRSQPGDHGVTRVATDP